MRIIIFLLFLCVAAEPIVSISADNTKLSISLGKTIQLVAALIVFAVFATIIYNIITGKKL